MLCRLYDTKEKRYIKADETMDYMVHPVGAVFHLGVEDHRVIVERSLGFDDVNGKEIFEGDIVSCDQVQGLGFKVVGAAHLGVEMIGDTPSPRAFLDTRKFQKHGSEFCIFHDNPEVIGTIHDEEMEAE